MKDGVGYVRDELDYVERKGLWFCGKLVKWMPRDEDDKGQDGESVVSQDIIDWEGVSHSLIDQGVKRVETFAEDSKDYGSSHRQVSITQPDVSCLPENIAEGA